MTARGLADSRHAPCSRPSSNNRRPSPLTVNPAPTGNGNGNGYGYSNGPLNGISNGSNGAHTTTNGASSAQIPSPAAQELARYTKIVRRLKWKLPFLAAGYQRVVERVGQDTASVAEAELMFKLDFFEYYMLVERALVHLLGVFSVSVSRGQDAHFSHRYHANVLDALDKDDNPLHEILGTGNVRRQLGRAKELRNRWKNAADEVDGGASTSAKNGTRMAAPLESYDLDRILTAVFDGFDAAFMAAERFVRESNSPGTVDTLMECDSVDRDQWDFMVDAMDWESV
jgi:hypothetical protein